MKMSEARRRELYRAISDPIMDLRVKFYRASDMAADRIDVAVSNLEPEIWRRVCLALNVDPEA